MYFQHPVPFHVAYPLTSFYEDEQRAQKDMELMKSFYPETSREIQRQVEKECDRMEYEGSMMYDEYPDPFMMAMTCKRISDQVKKQKDMEQDVMQAQRGVNSSAAAVDELIRILLCHEMFTRRCRRRRSRRYF